MRTDQECLAHLAKSKRLQASSDNNSTMLHSISFKSLAHALDGLNKAGYTKQELIQDKWLLYKQLDGKQLSALLPIKLQGSVLVDVYKENDCG